MRDRKLKNVVNKKYISVFGFLLIGLSGLVLLMAFEYASFRMHTQRLVFLQEHYRAYLQAAQNIIEKYGEVGKHELYEQLSMPAGIHIFSSDNQDAPSLIVNRERSYLKESTISYFKQQRLDSLLHQLRNELSIEETLPQEVSKLVPRKSKLKSLKSAKRSSYRYTRNLDLSLAWPIAKSQFWLSAFFGPRKIKGGSWDFHRGIDMAALKGTVVRAAARGTVVEAKYAPGYGNTVLIAHTPVYKTRYAHLDSMKVKVGQEVQQGAVIGYVGDTGRVRKMGVDASHLHFEVHKHGKQVNPIPFLQVVV